jgi:transcriptional regulator with XRE-family HTH domain
MPKETAPKGKKAADKRRKSPPSEALQWVGQRIRAARKERGFSQDKLAYSIPLDRAHIGMIENGKRAATIPTLIKIAVALDCDVGEFFPPIAKLKTVDSRS